MDGVVGNYTSDLVDVDMGGSVDVVVSFDMVSVDLVLVLVVLFGHLVSYHEFDLLTSQLL